MRDNTIDIGKFMASILVILIHTTVFDDVGSFIWQFDAILRLAVPFFIVCSGYYLGKRLQIETGKIAKTKFNNDASFSFCKKMCGIYIIWSIVHLVVLIPNWIQTGWFSPMAFVNWGIATILRGSYYHLWYILYMIYAVAIFEIFLKKLPMRAYPYVIVVLYVIEVGQYGYRCFLSESVQNALAIFDTLPCLSSITRVLSLLMLGIYIGRKRDAIKTTRNYFIGFLVALLCLVIERNILIDLGCEQVSYIFFTLPAIYFLFEIVISIEWKSNYINTKKLNEISTYIYLIHPICIVLVDNAFKELAVLNTLAIIILSIVSGYALIWIKDFKKLQQKRK